MSKKPQVKLRMDKSKYFSSVHGERAPGDPHTGICFYQGGLPFDGEGLLMLDQVPENLKDAVNLRLKRLNEAKPAPVKAPVQTALVADEETGDEDDDGDGDGNEQPGDGGAGFTDGEVNLESWLRGEANYPWFAITAAIRARFNKNITTKTDAVTFLVEDEKIVTPAQLAVLLQPHYVPAKV